MHIKILPRQWGHLGLGILLLSSQAAFADISGKVFRDFNANGVFDTGSSFNEVGMMGVTVKAFDADDAVSTPTATATSGVDGAYVLTGLSADTDYRVEFSWTESWLKPGSAGGTSVQFAQNGATDTNLSVQNPVQYCQAQPFIAIPEMLNGDPLAGGTSGNKQSLVSFSAGWAGNAGDTAPIYNILGLGKDTGAVHGLAYHPASSSLFMAAVAKRHIGFGSAGSGAIYKVSIDTATGEANSAPTLFVDMNALSISAGTINRSSGELSSNVADPNHDPNAFDAVGKISLGDIEISDDQKTLWVVNLFDRKLYGMAADKVPTAEADLKSFDLVSAFTDLGHICVDGEFRPWALKAHDGKVYVGGVCSAENVNETTQAAFGSSSDMDSQANRDKLHAYILALEPNSGVFTDVYDFPLNYERAQVGVEWNGANRIPAEWRPWIKSWDDIHDPEPGAGSYEQTIYPQPMLTDIEFDDDGKTLILGFLDRAGHQLGNANYSAVAGDTVVYEGTVAGDILRVCPGTDGKLALETNASCGGKTTAGAGTGEGPGNGEYYFADNYGTGHSEVALGGLARIYGLGKTVSNAYDPEQDYRSGGVFWLNDMTGAKDSAYVIYDRDDDGSSNGIVEPRTPATFGKAAGLGDMEALCNAAPIEVGNRVWKDTDEDGIQDADEAGIDDVDVVLTCGENTATAKTAGGGQFLFSSASNATFLKSGESCKLTIANTQAPLAGLTTTLQNADGATDNNALTDVRDSDASPTGEIIFTVGAVGENNHALDIGYKVGAAPTVHSIGNRVWIDADNDGIADSGEDAVGAGVKLDLKDASGSVLDTTTTDANGRYLFSGLSAGDYKVCVSSDNFAASAVLENYTASTGKTPAPNADTDNTDGDDNGSDDTVSGLCSDLVTLGTDEPTGETTVTGDDGDDGQGTPDANSNLTVDFGVVPPPVALQADLALTKTVNPASAKPGNTVVYTLTVANNGPDDATGVQVTDNLPAGVTWVSDDGAGAYDKDSGVWTVGNVINGSTKALNITVTIN